jgi:pyrroloquinoline quinone biosynthesis protein D
MMAEAPLLRPKLVPHARYRWDAVRQAHQLVFPEGLLVLNETGAAIVERCDGRTLEQLIQSLAEITPQTPPLEEVHAFVARLRDKGLLVEAACTSEATRTGASES